jgi:cyclohexyl-isocyanide hydratase
MSPPVDPPRWLYHALPRAALPAPGAARFAPPSLAAEGFIHASYREVVAESARLYLPASADPVVLQIDPRRLDVPVEVVETPRGPMPHLHGALPVDAIRRTWELDALGAAPDAVRGTCFAFVVFAGMTLLDFVGVFDPVSRLASMGFDTEASFRVIAADRAQVWSQGGATLSVEAVRPALDEVDVLIVAGGHGTRALEKDPAVLAWLAGYPANRLLSSVCTGALLLGAAGRLQGKRATTHHREMARLQEFGVSEAGGRVVEDGQLITAGGVCSGLDLGIYLVKKLMGEEVASKIATQMEWR